MFAAGSFLQSANVYLVENVVQSLMALGVVWLVFTLFKVRSPEWRIKFLLLPLILPLFAAPLFYLLFPDRRELPVLTLDTFFDLESVISDPGIWMTVSQFLTVAIMATAFFIMVKGVFTAIALYRLSRRFECLKGRDNRRIDMVLGGSCSLRPKVLLARSREIICCSFGVRKHSILISQGLLQRLSDRDLLATITHEIAHTRRGDGWLNLVLIALRHTFFFNPVVHIVIRRLRLEMELAADDLALSYGLDRLAYAETLLAMGRLSARPAVSGSLVNNFSGGAKTLKKRIEHVLQPVPPSRLCYRGLLGGTAFLILVVGFFLC